MLYEVITILKNLFLRVLKKLKQLIEFQIENKTDAIIITGTTGEASTLTDKEHLKVVEVATECINGRIRITSYNVCYTKLLRS